MTEWRAIPGWEGYYEVSDDGQVRSLTRRVRAPRGGTRLIRGQAIQPVYRKGYPEFMLWRGGRGRIISAHRLVMWAFVGHQPPGVEVLHGDGDSGRPDLSNLRYGSHSENELDKVRHGRSHTTNRTICPSSHRLIEPNLVRSQLRIGYRQCRACHQTHAFLKAHPELDFQTESDRRYAIIMAGTDRHSAGDGPAQIPTQRGAALARAGSAPGGEPS